MSAAASDGSCEDKEGEDSDSEPIELDADESIMPREQALALIEREDWAQAVEEEVSQVAMCFTGATGWEVSDAGAAAAHDNGKGVDLKFGNSTWEQTSFDIGYYAANGRGGRWFFIISM